LTPVRNSRPLFAGHPNGSETYVACLDCGKEFPYNWREMRIEKPPVLPSNASRVIVLE